MILGIDVSTYLEQQRITKPIYKKDGQEIDPFALFRKNGVTHLRTRIWNNPYSSKGQPYLGGTCDLDNYLDLCEKLAPYGFKQVVDFHYSDFWVDPSKQKCPKAWKDLTFEQVEEQIYLYTKDCLLKMKDRGIDVDMIQTGNEVTHGMVWPFGKLNFDSDNPYGNFAKLLISARKACKEIYPHAKIIIHLEESWNIHLYRHTLTELIKNGLEIDILGTSYYPFWHHSFDEYFACLEMVKKEFNIPVMNVELGYPFTLDDYLKEADLEGRNHMAINISMKDSFKEILPYDVSPLGQAQFIKKFIELGKEHQLLGAFYWEPLWIPGKGICWASEAGQKYQNLFMKDTRNEWSNQCLFDYEGNMLPAFDEYKMEN